MFLTSFLGATSNVNFEDFGKASDCAQYWRTAVMDLAESNGDDPNTDMVNGTMTYLELYMIAYTECVNN
jgi:hypothetical protein